MRRQGMDRLERRNIQAGRIGGLALRMARRSGQRQHQSVGYQPAGEKPEADRNAFLPGLESNWLLNDAWSVGVEYKPTFSGNWSNHALNGVLRYAF